MSNDETKFGNYFKLPNPGLRAYFDHVVQGNDEEYRTPFYKGKSLEQVLKGWSSEIDSLKEQWPSLVEFENDLRSKVGPMSIMKPLKDRISDIDSYYDSILLESKPISGKAVRSVMREFGSKIGGLRRRSQANTLKKMKLSTNSGSPYFTKRNTDYVLLEVEGSWLEKISDTMWTQHFRGPTKNTYYVCAVLGWRGQEGGPTDEDVKQRVVWMFPFAVNLAELSVYQPLIEGCQKHELVPAWVSMDAVDQRITKMFDTKGPDDDVICTDFSKFDQHFNQDMQLAAYNILCRGILDMSDSDNDEWLEDVFPIKYAIPLAYNFGRVRFGKHGMASGSGGTNADETLVHRALQYEAAQAHNAELNPNSQCLGDDGVLTYPGITVEDVVRSYSAHGQEMNLDKQHVSKQDCIYLRRWHHTDYRIDGVCVGVYSTYRALGRLCEQERFYDPDKWSKEMVALRQLSIIENCKYHPLREKFADYCIKGDKYRLGLDIPGFIDNIEDIANKANELVPDFLGYTKSMQLDEQSTSTGIGKWWIVNYLKSKR